MDSTSTTFLPHATGPDTAIAPIHADTNITVGPLPADSAFICGTLDLPDRLPDSTQDSGQTGEYIVHDTITALMAIVFLICMRQVVSILPITAGCLLRWKENLNLEYNVKSARARNRLALILFPAFCVIVSRYGIWAPSFLEGTVPAAGLGITAAAFIIILSLRLLVTRVMRPSGMDSKIWNAGNNALYTFFIATAIITICSAGIMSLCGSSTHAIKMTLLYEISAVWCIFLFRKMQIFKNSCSLFSSILYLCSLEILPMAAIVLPAVFA